MAKGEEDHPTRKGILLFTLLHMIITGLLVVVSVIEALMKCGPPLTISDNLFWVFEFPLRLVMWWRLIEHSAFYIVAIPINSLLYGVFWWFCYRMLRLMFARKPAE